MNKAKIEAIEMLTVKNLDAFELAELIKKLRGHQMTKFNTEVMQEGKQSREAKELKMNNGITYVK